MSRAIIELAGQRFGRLLVIQQAGRNSRGGVLWLCKCDCGAECTVVGYHLVANAKSRRRSCGCLKRETSMANMHAALKKAREFGTNPSKSGAAGQKAAARVEGAFAPRPIREKRDEVKTWVGAEEAAATLGALWR